MLFFSDHCSLILSIAPYFRDGPAPAAKLRRCIVKTGDAFVRFQNGNDEVLQPALSLAVNDLHAGIVLLNGIVQKVMQHLRNHVDGRTVQIEEVGDHDEIRDIDILDILSRAI